MPAYQHALCSMQSLGSSP